jgi:hypothetical protein
MVRLYPERLRPACNRRAGRIVTRSRIQIGIRDGSHGFEGLENPAAAELCARPSSSVSPAAILRQSVPPGDPIDRQPDRHHTAGLS